MGAALDVDWRAQALCRWAEDPELWFPHGEGESLRRNSLPARLICHQCPVEAECLEFALQYGRYYDFGVWGGTTHEDREKMRRKARRAR